MNSLKLVLTKELCKRMSDIRKTQRSFARKALAKPEHQFQDVYHLICRLDWIIVALNHVLDNTGARTAGVDGISREHLERLEDQTRFVTTLQQELKDGSYRPQPVKRIWIPKPGKSEKRPLGIPTIRDRVVQEVLRMLMEPIWESDFLNCSQGFRPGRRTMDCIRTLYTCCNRHSKYYWIIESDIRKCFDTINHKILLRLVRRRMADHRIVRLVDAFLKSGLLEDGLFQETPEGTPQGGILSPLLANIYLHELDMWWWRKFESQTGWAKYQRRQQGRGMAKMTRYADDFLILWNGKRQDALALKQELKEFLWNELHLELSEEKTHVTHIQEGFDFLGFHIRWETPKNKKPWLRVTPTQANIRRFRSRIKELTRRGTTFMTADWRFKTLNRILRGWGNYYRHVSFTHDAKELDWWVNQRILLWLKKKHQGVGVRQILKQYKQREQGRGYNRWNFGAEDEEGNTIFIAKMGDIPLTKYLPTKKQHPYLQEDDDEVLPSQDAETPFLDPGVVNVSPDNLELMENRKTVRKRDGYRCTQCGRTGEEVRLQVHHVQSRRENGSHAEDNLVTLCIDCHAKITSYGRPAAS